MTGDYIIINNQGNIFTKKVVIVRADEIDIPARSPVKVPEMEERTIIIISDSPIGAKRADRGSGNEKYIFKYIDGILAGVKNNEDGYLHVK